MKAFVVYSMLATTVEVDVNLEGVSQLEGKKRKRGLVTSR